MYLKKIRLLGFKSFCDPQLLELPTAIAAVVGPNGCGKSNIIDAVKCLTGQSKAREMRGEQISDLIFNGSDQRGAVGQAQVELVFDNRDQILKGPFAHYNEVAVKRIIGRDGHSTFFINQTRCRRRDVIDLFTGTGLGPKSYAIIEQGMIARFIEAKPAEVRAYIEEVAGISRYKERRRETMSQLQSSSENLTRLSDVKREMERQVAHLAEQAEEAQRYQELKEKLLHYRQQHHAYLYQKAQETLKSAEAELEKAQQSYEERVSSLRNVLQGYAEQEQKVEQAEAQLQQLQQSQHQVQLMLEQKKAQWQQARQRREFLEQDCQQWQQQQEQLQKDMAGLEQELSQIPEPWLALESDLAARAAELAECTKERTSLSSEYEALEAGLQTEKEIFQELQQQCSAHELRLEHASQEKARLERALESAQQQYAALKKDFDALDLTHLEKEATKYAQAFEKAQQDETQLSEQCQELATNVSQKKWQITQWQKQSADAQKQWEKADKILQSRRSEHVDWLSFTQASEVGIKDYPQHQEHLSALATTYLYHGVDRPPKEQWDKVAEKDCEYVWGQEKTPSYWQHLHPCGSWDEAQKRLPKLASHEALLLPGGCLLGPNWMRPQRHRAEPLLSELEEQAQKYHDSWQQLLAQITQTEKDCASAEGKLNDLKKQYHEAQKLRQEAQKQQQKSQHDLIRSQQRVGDLKERCKEKEAAIAEHQAGLENIIQTQEHTRTALKEQQEQKELQLSKVTQQEEKKSAAYQMYQQVHTRYEQAAERHREIETESQRLKMQRAQEKQQLEKDREQLQKITDLLKDKREQWEQSAAPIEQLEQEIADDLNIQESGTRKLHEEQEIVAGLQKDLEQCVRSQRAAGGEKDRAQNAMLQAQMALEKQQIHQTHLEEQILDHGWTVAQIAEMECTDPWDEVKKAMAISQKDFDALGPVNLRAIHEHQQQSQRLEELTSQCDDLEKATAQIEQALLDLDKEMHTLFHDTFSQLQKNFQELFPLLFGGGRAQLILEETEEGVEPGVIIQAQPPGKKNATLSLLSGGEKALTASALLFAFFQLNPAPFCLLDEIDAPLDDANTARLGQMIQSLSAKTQFIIVTHSKVMMEFAQALYGVTMKEPGVSRLVSVSLDEALEAVGDE